jgi:large subunit ribosomal protein L21
MKYVVFQTGGKQYKVSVGSEIEIEKIVGEAESNVNFEKVLLVADGDNVQIGQPNIDGVTIKARVLEQKKGKKIRVAKFKAKSRYRKVTGHRQHLTKVQITDIQSTDKKKSEKVAKVSKDK